MGAETPQNRADWLAQRAADYCRYEHTPLRKFLEAQSDAQQLFGEKLHVAPLVVLPKLFLDTVIVRHHRVACWVWTMALDPKGYGRYSYQDYHLAHCLSFDLIQEPLELGHVRDHWCGYRPCVNPFHLEGVTQRTNDIRGQEDRTGQYPFELFRDPKDILRPHLF